MQPNRKTASFFKSRSLGARLQALFVLTVFIVSLVPVEVIRAAGSLLPGAGLSEAELQANPDGDLRIAPITAYNLVVDSNVESPSTYAPEAATLAAEFCNDGANPLTDVYMYIGDFNSVTPSASTPGIYPTRNSSDPGFLPASIAGTGLYSLTHEGGSAGLADATRYIPSIPPGECATQYWLVSYPRRGNPNNTGPTVTGGIKPDDDLWLNYDFWVSANDGGSPLLADATIKVTMRNEISAAANKIWPNGDNKVPQQYLDAIAAVLGWDTFTPGGGNTAYPGETVRTQGIWYDLGNVGFGFDNNGDLVPDHNAWLQPVGIPSAYDPGCFRLVRTYGLVIVKLVGGGEYLIPFEDQLYFEGIPDNTGTVGLVFYEYAALDGACTAGLTPYQEVASGYDNEKFNGDFGYGIPPLQSVESEVTFDKNGPVSVAEGNPVTYTLSYTNVDPDGAGPLAVTVGDPMLGTAFTVFDQIPSGTYYVPGSAAGVTPAPSDYTVFYSTDTDPSDGITWTTTEPTGSPNPTTYLKWVRNDQVANGESGSVTFQVSVPSGYISSNNTVLVENTGCAKLGDAGCFIEDDHTTIVTGPNSLSGNVFSDTGGGAGQFANGIKDTGEGNIPNVTVTLYFDSDGDGDGDMLYGTASTDASGNYSFSGLPDGYFVVTVDRTDPDLPTGYANTTPASRTAALDPTHASAVGVTQSGLDFGFAPALSLNKELQTAGTVYVNDAVTFTIDVTNNLPGDGDGSVGACTYNVWSSIAHPDSSAIPPGGSNANTMWQFTNFALGKPDEQYSYSVLANADDTLGLSGFNIGNMGGNITSVQFVFHLRERYELKALDTFAVQVYYADGPLGSAYNFTGGTTFTGSAGDQYTITQNITGLRSWTFADFINNLTELQVTASKGSGPGSSGDLDLDAAGFIITTNQTCGGDDSTILNPVPLTDTYDPAVLQFLAATPPVTSSAPGVLTWSNVGPVYPGQTKPVTVTFKALAIATNSVDTATSANAKFANGLPANTPVSDTATVTIVASAATGSISGYVWDDDNNNGWQGGAGGTGYDAGDSFISDTLVTLYACKDLSGNLITGSVSTCQTENGIWTVMGIAYTNASGSYSFTNLRQGYYRVVVDDSAIVGHTGQTGDPNQKTGVCTVCDSQANAVTDDMDAATFIGQITGSNAITNVSFGYRAPDGVTSSIGDTLYFDWNGNSAQDAGEEGIPNVTVSLYDLSGDLVGTDVTDANGQYLFEALPAGAYTVRVDTSDPDFPASKVYQTADPDESGACVECDSLGHASVDGTASDLTQDFGYQPFGGYSIGDTVWFDSNADGVQAGVLETGIPNITVSLQVDFNNDGTWVTVASDVTDADGKYLFANLPNGDYRVVVDAADTDLPQDAFGNVVTPSTVTTYNITLNNASDLTADFGFYKPGAVGDTIFWDSNGDGEKDYNEPGIPGVTVNLYLDVDGNGLYDSGTDTFVASDVTDADGKYLISGIPTDADGEKYVAVVDTGPGSPVNGRTLTADPNADGLACTTNPEPWSGFYAACDNQVATAIYPGTSFMGADFGYQPSAVIGDTLWVDANLDGLRQATEPGLDTVTVRLCADAACSSVIAVTETDPDGYYYFTNVGDGTYYVVVDESDPDFPAGLVATYNATHDTAVDNLTRVVVSGSEVTQVGDDADPSCTNCGLTVDFGYRFAGNRSLGGTICLENSGFDGVCDTDASGVGANETAYQNLTVYLYVWNDDGDGSVEPGETTQVGSTQTNANGDYSFTNITDSVTYVVTIGAPQSYLDLTTTLAAVGAPTTQVVATPTAVNVTSAYQVVPLSGSDVEGRDFAFKNNQQLDFGDLPSPYSTLLTNSPDGPRHIVPASPTLYLGTAPDAETNGAPTSDASGDGADEDGVTFTGVWGNGTFINDGSGAADGSGGSVEVNVTGSGWLIGWIDFNRDGDFTDSGEMILSQSVTTGSGQQFGFDVPANTFADPGDPADLSLYARFRLFPSQPTFPTLAYSGLASNGEVEDYAPNWSMTIDKDTSTPSVSPTGAVTYQIVVANTGDLTLTNLQVTDNLDDAFGAGNYGSLIVTAPGLTVNGAYDGSTDTDLLAGTDSLAAGASATITIQLTLNTIPTGTYDNTAAASSDQTGGIDDDGLAIQDPGTPAGEDPEDDEDVTVTLTASIGDFVWNDLDGDGLQDGGEPGIDGVTLDLWLDANDNGLIEPATDTFIGTQTTAGGGLYNFTGLVPGRYLVDVTDTAGVLAGYYQTSGTDPQDVTVIAGQAYTDADFGYRALAPSLTLTKSASPVYYNAENDSITYTYTLENTGNVTLYGPFVVLDDKATVDCSGAAASLDPTETTTCTATYLVTAGDVTAGSVTNTATAYAGGIPALTVVKSASPATYASAGETINYSYDVTNVGNIPLTNVTLDDDRSTTESCPQTTLAVGETMTCTATWTITAADVTDGFVTNTVTVDSDQTGPVTDSATVGSSASASLTLSKTASPSTFTHAGQVIVYSYEVTNTGNTALNNISVTDDKAFSVSCPSTTLAVGNAMTCTATYTVTAADLAAGSVTNTATADSDETAPVSDTKTVPQVPVESNTDTETVTLAALTIDKDTSTASVTLDGIVTYTIIVTNTGDLDLTNLQVTDTLPFASGEYSVTTVDAGAYTENPAYDGATDTNLLAGTDTLGIGQAATITVTLQLVNAAPGVYDNTAVASTTETGNVDDDGLAAQDPGTPPGEDPEDDEDVTVISNGTVSGHLYIDTNGNGTQDLVEPNLANVDVIVTDASGNTQTATTDANGDWTATVPPGSTTADVDETDPDYPAGYTQTEGTDPTTVTAVAGVDTDAGNDGYYLAGNISGMVFDDLNGDGNFDAGEPGIPGVIVNLYDSSDTFIATTTTNGAGYYEFTGLPAGGYYVVETDPAGYASTGDADGSANGINRIDVTLNAGDSSTGNDFFDGQPAITVTKTANPTSVPETGGSVTFTYTVTNSGAVPVTITSLSDDQFGVLTGDADCQVGTVLVVGANCAFDHTTSLSGAAGTTHTNIFTADAEDTNGNPASDNDNAVVTFTDVLPAITVTKTANPTVVLETGGNVTFTYTVTNSGTVPATITSLNDDQFGILAGDADCQVGTVLAAGANCAFDYTTALSGAAGTTHTNIFTAEAQDSEGNTASDTASEDVTFIAPAIDIRKNAEGADSQQVLNGGDVTFTIRVENTGDVALTNVTVSDPLVPDCDASFASLAAGEVQTYTCTAMGITADFVNVATVTGTDPLGIDISDNDPSSVDVIAPAIDIRKNAEGADSQQVLNGGDVTFTIRVENTGDVALTNVTVSDPLAPDCEANFATLAVGEVQTYTCTVIGVAADFVNVATATGTDPLNNDISDSDPSSVDVVTPSIQLVKTGALNDDDGTPGLSEGDTISYAFTVTNTGDVTLTNITLADTVGGVTISGGPIPSLDPGASDSVTFTGSYILTQADIDAGSFTNTATVTGTPPIGPDVTDPDDDTQVLTASPALTLDKVYDGYTDNDTSGDLTVGDDLNFTITMTNTGNITLTNVVVSDPDLMPGSQACASVTPGGTCVLVGSYTVTQADVNAGSFSNTAAVTDDDVCPAAGPATCEDTVITPITQNPSYTVTKNADVTSVNAAGDVITYTIEVTNTGNVTLTGVSVSDPLLADLTRQADNPGNGDNLLDMGETWVYTGTYTVTQADLDDNGGGDGDIDNTVTVDTNEAGSQTDSETVPIVTEPAIQVVKEVLKVEFVNPNIFNITYRIRVTNTGNQTLLNIQVKDDLKSAFSKAKSFSVQKVSSADFAVNPDYDGDTDINLLMGTDSLNIGESGSITLKARADTGGKADSYANTAVASGITPDLEQVTDDDTVEGPSFADPAVLKAADLTKAGVGDIITFTITVSNNGNAPATNVTVVDPLPAILDVVDAKATRGDITVSGRTVTVKLGDLAPGEIVIITIRARVNATGQPPIINKVTLTTDSATDNISNNTADIRIDLASPELPQTGFAPGRKTALPEQPGSSAYASYDGLALEIAALGKTMPIVGVPQANGTWDVSWLGSSAGWLVGSAFPSWSGNSVLTGHVTTSEGLPGPFALLRTLKWGDRVIVHAYGQRYVYEVREVKYVSPFDTSSVLKHEDYSWLTLLTCYNYNEALDIYNYRVAVRAVLVSVSADTGAQH